MYDPAQLQQLLVTMQETKTVLAAGENTFLAAMRAFQKASEEFLQQATKLLSEIPPAEPE